MSSRYQALMALWLFQVVNYLDRASISFAGPTMMKSMGLNAQDFGVVLSAFAAGYFVAQLPGGLLADRLGAKFVFILTPILWAFSTFGVGLVAGIAGLVTARLCLGLAEGIGNSAVFKFIGDNFPSRERARASGLWATSFAVAPALGGPLIALLLVAFDWRVTFMLLAILAFAAAAINYFILPSGPSAAFAPAQPGHAARTLFSELLRQPALWCLALAYMFFNVGYWGYNGWMPSYLAAAHHVDLRTVGLVGGIPYVFGIAGLLVLGWLAGASLYAYRAQLWAASFVLAGLFLFLAYQSDTLFGALAGLSGAAFFLYGSLALFAAILIDYAPADSRASFSAMATTAGQLGGVVAPLVIGYLVQSSGTYGGGFTFMVVTMIAAAAFALGLAFVRRPEAQMLSPAMSAAAN